MERNGVKFLIKQQSFNNIVVINIGRFRFCDPISATIVIIKIDSSEDPLT